jgi:transposase
MRLEHFNFEMTYFYVTLFAMRIASEEIRSLAVGAYESGLADRELLAKIFSRSVGTLDRWTREARESGRLAPLARGHRPPLFSEAEAAELRGFIDGNPGATLEEIRAHFKKQCSLAAMCKIVARLGYTLKKKRCGQASKTGGTSKKSGASGLSSRQKFLRAGSCSLTSRGRRRT